MFGPQRDEPVIEHVALVAQRVGVALGFVGGGHFHGGLGDDGAQSRVLRGVVKEPELLGGNREFGVGLFDAFAHIEQTAFDRGPRHEPSVRAEVSESSGVRAEPG